MTVRGGLLVKARATWLAQCVRRRAGVLVALGLPAILAGLSLPVAAAPVAVRFPEGIARGFLAIRTPGGERIAGGELIQTLRGARVHSRLVFRFRDGSLSDETVVFTQSGVFRLVSYTVVQRGPSFPEPIDASFGREPDAYAVRARLAVGRETALRGALSLPPDVYTGMLGVVLKNLRDAAPDTVSMVAFTPVPRILDVPLVSPVAAPVGVGGMPRRAALFHLQPVLRGVLGLVAPLIGRKPPSLRFWILAEEVPAFLRFEGPFYAGGPVWRVELDSPDWLPTASVEGR